MTGAVMTGSWLVVAEDAALGDLLGTARGLGGPVAAAVIGSRDLAQYVAPRADRVDWFPTTRDVPAEAWSSAVADQLAGEGAIVTLAGNDAASRIILGAVAARLRAPVLAPVQDLRITEAGVEATRLVYGGIAVEHDAVAGPVCLVVEGGTRRAPYAVHDPVEVRRIQADPLFVTCPIDPVAPHLDRDLASADRVIGVGRGLGDPARLAEIECLAEALGAEIACSRPVAEDLGWLPRDRYLGVSGRRIAPKLYLMLGISGEIQHMIGVRDAGLIVAVNTDARAPVVTGADLTVIGDLHAIVPALIRQLTSAGRRSAHA
ncbi:electron transfer flavoprotein subunit alpha/FixB family protein [Raineyella sp. W15-4]|uniref:electron transfer flavoprotein subunit alpha/FixB family protein n=1 Tax=Raineyella sp. W15-4 TaxID=3081651 RepID=UPI002955DC45|nr:electron transfer flavoprotein subunit alpha/FixB family protein [Raineyella sp. W15-4]WOQ18045.1 electron transfer flavoprotein subunit alpha/FixB family protein [Raineyella sp. W15-4]